PVCEKCGKDFEGNGVYCNFCQWHMRWSEELLNSPDLASRRKRSHDVKILSLNPEVPEAEFLGSKPKNAERPTYHTTLTECTCVDFVRGGGARPCKHMLRLAEELGLFQNEYFLSGEHDYTMDNPSYVAGEKKNLGDGVYSCDFIWRTRWASEVLYSMELTSRRKFSHSVGILSIDKEKMEAVCQDPDDTRTYITTLTNCTCEDYSLGFGIRPCRHIFRLAEELNLFQCEHDVFADYGKDIRLDFSQLDDSKASKTKKRLIFNVWKELLYGFNSAEDGVEFIKSLKLTVQQLKEFSQFEKILVVFGGRKKSEIIDAIVDRTTGHSHRQLLRWLADQIYKYNDLEECKEFLTGLNLTTSQITEFAEFKQIELSGNNEKELIESLVAQTVGKKAINDGNVIVINFDVNADRLKLKEICEREKLSHADEETGTKEADISEVQNTQEEISKIPPVASPILTETADEILTEKKTAVASMFLKLLKYACCGASGFFALVLLAGAFAYGMQSREWLCFPVAFAIAGFLTANTARRNALDGSAFKWWLYGAIMPVVSWIDVVMSCSQNKVKGFMKGVLYSLLGILAFLIVFVQFLPAVPKP
ncbi:MAG: SWIM zinc finger family protein, partial [Synergistaceae bacterium]|nr:SWIM zinc finger family protein [Synergistaceae bacterium]